MKKILTFLCALLLSVGFLFAGCQGNKITVPENYTKVVSNGGFVVGSGNYAYFANAYKSYQDLNSKSDNDASKNSEFGLKRQEIDLEIANRTGLNLKDVDLQNVLGKITAYENSNIYVVEQYLYFTTPNVHKSKTNEYEFNLTTLFRVKLDGTGLKEVYTTKSDNSKFYLTGGENKKILIFDDKTIKTVDVEKGSTSTKELVTGVESVVFPHGEEEELAYLYFTSSREENSFSGNILNKVSLATGETSIVFSVPGETVTILAYDFGRLFFTRTGADLNAGLYSTNFQGNTIKHRNATDISNLIYVECENENYNSFVFTYNNKLYSQLVTAENDMQDYTVLYDKNASAKFSSGSYIYFTASDGIYRISLIDKVVKQLSNISSFKPDALDFDGRYVYFFAKNTDQTTENYYLFSADCFAEEITTNCIGVLAEEDVVEED